MGEQPPSPAATRSPDKRVSKKNQTAYHPSSTIPSSDSMEDGEIVEHQLLAIEPLPPRSEQPKGQPQLFLSHASSATRTPPSSAATVTVASHTPCYAPINEPMTDGDLDQAKSLVLDLLGWGVTPEYIVECGVSPGTVYKIFTDLRLRLPNNLVPR